MAGPILTGSNQQPRWHVHRGRADFVINPDGRAFSRRLPWHSQGGKRCSLTGGVLQKVYKFIFGSSFCLNRVSGLFPERGALSACPAFFDPRVFPPPRGISVGYRGLEIVGLDSESGLNLGESRTVLQASTCVRGSALFDGNGELFESTRESMLRLERRLLNSFSGRCY
jgi:hypothetical protein